MMRKGNAYAHADHLSGRRELQGGRHGGAGGGKDGGHFGLRKGNKALHDSGIKLRAAGFDKPANGLFVRKANAVRARGNHGVKGVDHGDDARNDRNFGALKAGRIRRTAQPYSGCFFIRAYSSASRRPGFLKMASGIPTLPISCRRAATSRFWSSASSRPSSWPTRMPHSARRVLCTPVLRSFKSRSWLKAQITELRSAVTCSSTCLTRKESGVRGRWEATPRSAGRSVSMAITNRANCTS